MLNNIVALASEIVRNSNSLSDAEAGPINGRQFDDFQNCLTSSKKEL